MVLEAGAADWYEQFKELSLFEGSEGLRCGYIRSDVAGDAMS
jgi:hypothetical protein